MIDTTVDGSVAAVAGLATWLRGTLRANLTTAADLSVAGRRIAGDEWEGEDADAYSDYTRRVVTMTDEHAVRVGRAAQACDAYAARLDSMKAAMSGIRDRAVSGGLSVSGNLIQEPSAVEATVVQPGSPEEAAHEAAVAKVELYNTLVSDTTSAWNNFDDWILANLVPDVADAEETGGADKLLGKITSDLPDMLAGLGAGLAGVGLKELSNGYRGKAREFRRKSRVSGDPRIHGQAHTPSGASQLDDLLGKAGKFGKAGRVLGGPVVGVGIDVGFGLKEGHDTGDWTRTSLTTGTSIVGGLGTAAVFSTALSPVGVVVVGGIAAYGAAKGVGYVYDHRDDIADWTGDRWDDAGDLAGDAKRKAGKAWDKVTPW